MTTDTPQRQRCWFERGQRMWGGPQTTTFFVRVLVAQPGKCRRRPGPTPNHADDAPVVERPNSPSSMPFRALASWKRPPHLRPATTTETDGCRRHATDDRPTTTNDRLTTNGWATNDWRRWRQQRVPLSTPLSSSCALLLPFFSAFLMHFFYSFCSRPISMYTR